MTIIVDDRMTAQIAGRDGFIAALDQSGGSTPGALRLYGIPDTAYSGDAEMFKLMHQMRVRIMTSPAFTGAKVIAAILFEGTMDGEVQGKPTPAFLWEERHVVPFVKVDKGLDTERDGVNLMRPMLELDVVLDRAVGLGVFGTRSVRKRKTGSRPLPANNIGTTSFGAASLPVQAANNCKPLRPGRSHSNIATRRGSRLTLN